MIYEIIQTIITQNDKRTNNRFFIQSIDLPFLLKHITIDEADNENFITYFSTKKVEMYVKHDKEFHYEKFIINPYYEELNSDDRLYVPDRLFEGERSKFVDNLQKLLFENTDCILSLSRVMNLVNQI